MRLGGSPVNFVRTAMWRALRLLLQNRGSPILPPGAAATLLATPLDALLIRSLELPAEGNDEERRAALQVRVSPLYQQGR
jgi:hypothetical protein